MPEDPEIKIKVDTELESNSSGPKLETLLAVVENEVNKASKAFAELEVKVRAVQDSAAAMADKASLSVNPEIVEKANAAMGASANAIQSLSADFAKAHGDVENLAKSLSALVQGFNSGSISADSAKKSLKEMFNEARELTAIAKSLSEALKQIDTKNVDIGNLEPAIEAYNKLREHIEGVAAAAASYSTALEAQAEEHAALREALDKNAEGYEKQSDALRAAEKDCLNYSAQLKNIVAALNEVESKSLKPLIDAESVKDFEAYAESIDRLLEKVDEYGEKIEEINERAAQSEEEKTNRITEAAEAAQEAAEKQAEAQERAAEKQAASAIKQVQAAEKEAAAQEKMAFEASLAGKSLSELINLTRELMDARKQAAASGDMEAYKRLTEQIKACKTQMTMLKKETQLASISFMQHIQTSQSLAGQISGIGKTIGGLSDAAQNGELNITSLIGSVYSLGMAFKSAMGPLGLFMLALEAGQAVYNYFVKSANEVKKATQELAEIQKKATEEQAERAENAAKRESEAIKKVTEAKLDALKREEESAKSTSEQVKQAQEYESNERLSAIKQSIEKEIALKEAAYNRGEITKVALEQFRAECDEKLRMAVDNEAEIARETSEKRLQEEKDFAQKVVNERKKELDEFHKQYSGVIDAWENSDSAALKVISSKLDLLKERKDELSKQLEGIDKELETAQQANKSEEELEKIRQKRKDVNNEIHNVERAQKDLLEYTNSGPITAIMEAFEGMKEAEGLSKEQLFRLAETIAEEAKTHKVSLEDARNRLKEARDNLDTTKRNNELKRKEEEHNREVNKINTDSKIETLKQKDTNEHISLMIDRIKNNTKERVNSSDLENATALERAKVEKEQLRLQLRELERLRAQSYSTKLDPKMVEKLKREIENTREAYRKAGLSVKKARIEEHNNEIKHALKAIVNRLKEAETYEVEDNRSRRQKINASREIYQAELANLRRQRVAAAGNADKMEEIDGLIKNVQNNLRGLGQAVKRNAEESSKWLKELKPPKFQGKNKFAEKNIERVGERYARLAKLAEEAVRNGKMDRLSAIQKDLRRIASDMNRWGKNGNEGTLLYKQTIEALKEEHAAVKASKASSQKAKDAQRRRAEAADKAAKNAEEQAKEKREKEKKYDEKIAELTSVIEGLEAGMNNLRANHAALRTSLSSLSGAMDKMANFTAEMVSIATLGFNNANNRLAAFNAQLKELRNAVDKLSRNLPLK